MLLDKKHQKIILLAGWSLVLATVTGLMVYPEVALANNKVASSEFSSNRFEGNWQRTDQPIAAQKVARSWYWGPTPLAGGFYEDYADSPFRTRLVQYFDKARMELNNSKDGNVTNGLLVVEMITGRPQVGDNTFVEREPATVPVAGDLDNTFPTYRDLKPVYNQGLADTQIGQVVNERLVPTGGRVEFNEYRTDPAVRIVRVDNGLGIPAAFWEYLNRSGVIYQQGRYLEGVISDWLFSTGHPITEAYWSRVRVAGVEKDVMFQAFERRLLTYTPANEATYRVEMGNVGLQYAQWRYGGKLPQFSNPLESLFSNTVTQPEWYTSLEVLNIRTAPTSKAAKPENTLNKPYVQQLQPGDNVLVVRSVAGEELLKGNNIWLQIYEKPDLFVYSAYLKKAVVPDYPNPPRRHSGLWVSVSTGKQMMAVYNGNQLIYKTLVATGRPGVGERDYSTVKGVYSAIGGYRPESQTMAGGSRASDSYYSIDEIRYVTYFYLDYAIHGSYWHAKFGIAPQSHGCVNATVYDASLVWRLPVGTIVDVF